MYRLLRGRSHPIWQTEVFNSDQGAQFTSDAFTDVLKREAISISMDGRGRVFDNIFVERLWRSVKYEDIYLQSYSDAKELKHGLKRYFDFYNKERPHQALSDRTPQEVYESDQEYSTLILQKYPVRFNYEVSYIATLLVAILSKQHFNSVNNTPLFDLL